MFKLEVLLSLQEDQAPDALDAPLAGEAERIRDSLARDTTVRVAHSLEHHRDGAARAGDPLPRLEDLIATGLPPSRTPVPVTSFDAVIELSVADGTDVARSLAAVQGLVGRLGGAVDPARSAAVLGADVPVLEGDAPLQLFYCLRRPASLTHQEFSDYWRNELVRHTKKTPGKSAYRQVHADPALTVQAAAAAGVAIDDVDGVALEWYPDLANLWVAIDWATQPRAEVVVAEAQMSDFRRAMAMLSYSSPS